MDHFLPFENFNAWSTNEERRSWVDIFNHLQAPWCYSALSTIQSSKPPTTKISSLLNMIFPMPVFHGFSSSHMLGFDFYTTCSAALKVTWMFNCMYVFKLYFTMIKHLQKHSYLKYLLLFKTLTYTGNFCRALKLQWITINITKIPWGCQFTYT